MSIFKNNLRGVLFDMDGTVLDSEGLFDKAQIQYLEENNIFISKSDLCDFKGLSYKDFYPLFKKKKKKKKKNLSFLKLSTIFATRYVTIYTK